MIGANSLLGSNNLVIKRGECSLGGSFSCYNNCDRNMVCCKKRDFVGNMGLGCFKNNRDLEVEAVHGSGEEMWDAGEVGLSKQFPEHLVIMVNGIIGSVGDWRYGAEQFVKRLPDKVIVHRSECNSARLTFDGVDLMGERLAEEVLSVVRRRPGIRKNSSEEHSRQKLRKGRVAGLEPLNFITFATPHLGSRGNKQLPLLCGLPFLEKSASKTAHWIVGRTGKHLFLTDQDAGRSPLLLRMATDCDDLKFISALRAFDRCVTYANANYDHMVGWRTSSIRRQHELPQSRHLVKSEKYPHILYVKGESDEDTHKKASSRVRDQIIELEEDMIKGLTQVSWERVDVSFKKSTQRLIAHSTIQVKSYWLNSDGADVVLHMIDNFHL